MKPTILRVDKCPRCSHALRERDNVKNAHLHAVLSAVSHQKQWHGAWLDVEAWKRLFIAAYERYKGHSVEMYPAIDGEGMDVVFRRSSWMSQEEIRELIHFVEAQAVEWGIELEAAA